MITRVSGRSIVACPPDAVADLDRIVGRRAPRLRFAGDVDVAGVLIMTAPYQVDRSPAKRRNVVLGRRVVR
jgi:hypothetical protein